jgi:phosphatidylglycerophosphate synthase
MRLPLPDKLLTDVRTRPFGLVMSPPGLFFAAALLGVVLLLLVYEVLFGTKSQSHVPVAVGTAIYLFGVALAGFRLKRAFPHRALGLCNLVTLARLVIVGILCAVVLAGIAPDWATFGIAALALSLDGVDGWLARWQGLSSDFGAWFDVEVDAAFALILAVYAATNGAAGGFVILLGVPHYLFWSARRLLPWLDRPLRPSLSRKAVCVFQIGTLIALQAPFISQGQLNLVIAAVALALIWSFGRDILWLWRTREEAI